MFARTERLLLRPGWTEDAPALKSAIADPAVIRNLAQAPWPYEIEDARAFLTSGWNPARPNFLAFSRTRGAPRLIGGCGIRDDADGDLELGYWIARPYWGLGFATEAASAVMQLARATGMPRIKAGHFVDNPASGRVLCKLGFRPTGRVEKRFSRGRGTDVETMLFEDSGSGAGPKPGNEPVQELYTDQAAIAA
ncbi:MAG: GNAT family N-acetyltransferase [Sphingobium sp.]|nr:GNAT family N-acetyltransferase [Sphingobium sp.]MCP5398046.1 GNAT family N-acetyltransferase [Sphingomonas sp.]